MTTVQIYAMDVQQHQTVPAPVIAGHETALQADQTTTEIEVRHNRNKKLTSLLAGGTLDESWCAHNVIEMLVQPGVYTQNKKPYFVVAFDKKIMPWILITRERNNIVQAVKMNDDQMFKKSCGLLDAYTSLFISPRASKSSDFIKNYRNISGFTFWDMVSDQGRRTKISELLLDYGTNVNTRFHDGSTSLHQLAYRGYVDLVQLLLEYGADVNSKNEAGQTPLHPAVYNVDLAENDNLFSRHADPVGIRTKIVALLLEHGAHVDSQDHDGETPLHQAAYYSSNQEIITMLLDYGARLDVQDNNGDTPYDLQLIQHVVFWRNLHQVASYVFERLHVK